MDLPTLKEYAAMLGRLQNTMAWVSEEVENLAPGTGSDEIATRLRDLLHCVFFRIGNDENDPVPKDLPSIATTPTPGVGSGERPLANFPRKP
jgi:hypothetical protein